MRVTLRNRPGGRSAVRNGIFRGVAQLASVRALGAWGRGFESRLPDFTISEASLGSPQRPSGLAYFIGKLLVPGSDC